MLTLLQRYMNFSSRLLSWYYRHGRDLPWRASRNPYHVWVSEVILQQTRMEQGLIYFDRFVRAFPDVHALAAAPEDHVLRLWQGLGYYSRARNLHHAARQIVDDMNGRLPETGKEWSKLRGVGPYTAGAIASIAFNEAVPALDGNTVRVLARLFAIEESMDVVKGKTIFDELARSLLPEDRPGDFNQALMDFGSMVCRPANPLCAECIFRGSCKAFRAKAVNRFPVRKAKMPPKDRYFNYFFFYLVHPGGDVVFFVRQRTGNDIWRGMYELPLLETEWEMTENDVLAHEWWASFAGQGIDGVFTGRPFSMKQLLTHQRIHARFFGVRVDNKSNVLLSKHFMRVNKETFEGLAKPRLLERFFRQHMPRYSDQAESGTDADQKTRSSSSKSNRSAKKS